MRYYIAPENDTSIELGRDTIEEKWIILIFFCLFSTHRWLNLVREKEITLELLWLWSYCSRKQRPHGTKMNTRQEKWKILNSFVLHAQLIQLSTKERDNIINFVAQILYIECSRLCHRCWIKKERSWEKSGAYWILLFCMHSWLHYVQEKKIGLTLNFLCLGSFCSRKWHLPIELRGTQLRRSGTYWILSFCLHRWLN